MDALKFRHAWRTCNGELSSLAFSNGDSNEVGGSKEVFGKVKRYGQHDIVRCFDSIRHRRATASAVALGGTSCRAEFEHSQAYSSEEGVG